MKVTLEQQQQSQDLYQELVVKAWESAAFKEQLIENPIKTIESITGGELTIKDEVKVLVEDQTDSNIIYLNIPRKINFDEEELTDKQLESIAGGGPFYDLGYWYANTLIDAIQWVGDQFTRE